MYIGFFEYDGKTYFFGRASDGSTTSCSQNLNAIRQILQDIENKLYPDKREYMALNAEPIQAFVRKILDENEKAVDLADGIGIVQMIGRDPDFLIFDINFDVEPRLVESASSLENAVYLAQQYRNGLGL